MRTYMRCLHAQVLGLGVLFCLLGNSQAITKNDLYPYGVQQGDERLQVGDDISSSEVQLVVPISFYERLHTSLYVNLNGHVSFETELPGYKSDLILPIGLQVIAPFLADIDTRLSGNVYYRETQDPSLLEYAARQIQDAFGQQRYFQPDSLFLVTWDDVGYYSQKYDKTNTFQLVLANNARDTYAMFHYPRDGINWLRSEGKSAPVHEDVPAQAGFDSGDRRRYYTLPGSGNVEVASITQWSNVDRPGAWIFRIGNLNGGDIETPDSGRTDGGDGGQEEPANTCDEGGYLECASTGQCTDYATGFCCQCVAPQFGNGRNCLDPGVPQRVNGKVVGQLNGVNLDSVDLHTYVVTADGRAYTAISRVEPNLGTSMLSLYTIGSVFGWLFGAQATPTGKNGYSITGGDFNRSVVVRFQSGGETVDIKQQFVGKDAEGYMRANMVINGNVPNIPTGAKLTVDDYKEEFTRSSPGLIKAYSTHTYRVDGVAYQFTVDQTIKYKECAASPPTDIDSMRLHVTRTFLIYGESEQIVRYAATHRVSTAGSSDPCSSGANDCHEMANCVPGGPTGYRCECKVGYRGNGYSCEDVDECAFGQDIHGCSEFAQCINYPGNHECRCQPGYTGDGRDCRRDSSCGQLTCSEHARCVYDADKGQPMCECESGFTGDGERCDAVQFSCNEVNNCDANAECIWDGYQYKCECMDGFSGDGFTCSDSGDPEINCQRCSPYARCMYDIDRLYYRCQCWPGYSGDGYTCSPIGGPVEGCRVENDCDSNAQCAYDHLIGSYTCRCNDGFAGDGYRCERQGCDIMRNCDTNAQCLFDNRNNLHRCVCNNGFMGDGYRCELAGCDVSNFCDYNAQCVYDGLLQAHVCRCNDGYVGDGRICEKDENTGGVSCNQVNTCDVNADCIYDPATGAHVCRCKTGYQGDGYVCQLFGDCSRDPAICDLNAQCLRRGLDFVCECNPGYRGDGTRCSLQGSGASYLLFAQGTSILQMPFNPTPDNPGQQTIATPGQTAIGIDTDCYERYVYWTDISGKKISRARLDGTESEVIVKGLGSPEGVAVDWLSRNMYWTDSGLDRIEVSQLDGSNRKTLFDTDIVNPRAIVVDAPNGIMFWSDWNREDPKIEKAYMDGTNRAILVKDNLGLPNALVIDHETHSLCWADAGTMHIECSNFQGRNRRTIYALASYPFGLAYAENIFYWTDWDMKSMPSIDKYGGQLREPMTLPAGGNGRLYGLTAVKSQCPAGSNTCALNNGGCRFLCLPTPNGGRSCACPSDVNEEECNKVAFLK